MKYKFVFLRYISIIPPTFWYLVLIRLDCRLLAAPAPQHLGFVLKWVLKLQGVRNMAPQVGHGWKGFLGKVQDL